MVKKTQTVFFSTFFKIIEAIQQLNAGLQYLELKK